MTTEEVSLTPTMVPSSVCWNMTEDERHLQDRKDLGISMSTPILMMSAGVLGNLLALLVLFTADKHARSTAFFPLLLAMACSDFVGQSTTGAIAVMVYANDLRYVGIGGRPLCQAHGFAMVFFGVITPLLVATMSVERLLALRFSFFYRRCFTPYVAKWLMAACLAFTLAFCCCPFLGLGSYARQFPGSWCFLNFHHQSGEDVVYALLFSIINIVVIAIIIACNATVVWTLLRMRHVRHQMSGSPSSFSLEKVMVKVKAGTGRGWSRGQSRHRGGGGGGGGGLHMEMETQMVWFLLAITVVFSCLWLPINVHILSNQVTGQRDCRQDLISVRLASINQIIDPWMYVILRKNTFFKFLRRLKQAVQRRHRSVDTFSAFALQSLGKTSLVTPPRPRSCPPEVCGGSVHVSPSPRHVEEGEGEGEQDVSAKLLGGAELLTPVPLSSSAPHDLRSSLDDEIKEGDDVAVENYITQCACGREGL